MREQGRLGLFYVPVKAFTFLFFLYFFISEILLLFPCHTYSFLICAPICLYNLIFPSPSPPMLKLTPSLAGEETY